MTDAVSADLSDEQLSILGSLIAIKATVNVYTITGNWYMLAGIIVVPILHHDTNLSTCIYAGWLLRDWRKEQGVP